MKRLTSALALAALAACLGLPALADITVTDLRGRTVTIPKPAEKVMLGFYFEDFLAITGPGAIDRVVAISRPVWEGWRPFQWKEYVAAMPRLDTLPDVGDTETATFSIEKAIAAGPDLAILAAWQFDALGENVKQFEAAGIPVVVLDYNAQTLERHLLSTRVLGAVMGQPERAEAQAALYEAKTLDTLARVAKAGPSGKKVYVELAQKGPAEVGNTYGNGMWAGIIEMAGGANIAKGQIENWGPLAPEFVLAAQPDVILLTGSEWLNRPASVPLGFGATESLANERMAAYAARPGWADLPAVKNGQVYGVYHGGTRTLSDFVYGRYIAKALYPEAFADVDPAAEIAAYYAEWLPISAAGLFVAHLQ